MQQPLSSDEFFIYGSQSIHLLILTPATELHKKKQKTIDIGATAADTLPPYNPASLFFIRFIPALPS